MMKINIIKIYTRQMRFFGKYEKLKDLETGFESDVHQFCEK